MRNRRFAWNHKPDSRIRWFQDGTTRSTMVKSSCRTHQLKNHQRSAPNLCDAMNLSLFPKAVGCVTSHPCFYRNPNSRRAPREELGVCSAMVLALLASSGVEPSRSVVSTQKLMGLALRSWFCDESFRPRLLPHIFIRRRFEGVRHAKIGNFLRLFLHFLLYLACELPIGSLDLKTDGG